MTAVRFLEEGEGLLTTPDVRDCAHADLAVVIFRTTRLPDQDASGSHGLGEKQTELKSHDAPRFLNSQDILIHLLLLYILPL